MSIHFLLWPEYYMGEKYLSTVGIPNGEGTSGILCCPDVSKGFMAIVGFIINISCHWWSSKKNQINMLTNNSIFSELLEFPLNTHLLYFPNTWGDQIQQNIQLHKNPSIVSTRKCGTQHFINVPLESVVQSRGNTIPHLISNDKIKQALQDSRNTNSLSHNLF